MLYLVLLGLPSLPLTAKPLKVIRSGSADGIHYDYVKQDPGWFKDELICRNEGTTKCAWLTLGEADGHFAEIVDLLHSEIEPMVMSGATSGTISGSVAGYSFSGTWTGSINSEGEADYEVNVDVVED